MTIYCPNRPIILTIDGIEEEHPANTDILITEKNQTYNFFFGVNNYAGGNWTPTQFNNLLNLGIRGLKGQVSSGARMTLTQILELVTTEDRLFIINNYAPDASVTTDTQYLYYPPNNCPQHTALRAYINGGDIWGYTAGFLHWQTAPIPIHFWEIFKNGVFHKRTLEPVTHRCNCEEGTEWDEECQDCACTVICDGTIASMIRSIVL